MCHALLQDIKFFKQLLRIDRDLAEHTRAQGCQCGGILHQANYPRKPRGCPNEVRRDYESRFSFCCSSCRKRQTSMSVRFLGRRVYLAHVAGVGHPDTNPATLAPVVARSVPLDDTLASRLCALHAGRRDQPASSQPARTLLAQQESR